ncbi:MAG TPA: hypothetical protein VGA37_10920 [Gemmatimonadales bacterium]
MSVEIRRFRPADIAGIDRLNERLAAHGVPWPVYPEDPDTAQGGAVVATRMYLAADEEIRGAVWLTEQDFWVAGRTERLGWVRYPVSESLIDGRFGGIPGSLLLQLLREQPRLMALGLGGHEGPFAKLLARLGWAGVTVPFYFRLVRPARVLRHLAHVRRTRLRRVLLDTLAWSGVGWAGWKLYDTVARVGRPAAPRGCVVEEVAHFGTWADAVWERARGAYGFVATRDQRALNEMYPQGAPVRRLRITRDGTDIGWACVVRRDLSASPGATGFGPLRVGLLADGLALPGDAATVSALAASRLQRSDVDLMFSNQCHPAWGAGLRRAGFLAGPSQFAFYYAPSVGKLLSGGIVPESAHINRGDCDGPVFR